jgi:hypothetical protein
MKTFTKKREFSNNDYSKKTDCMNVVNQHFSEGLNLLPKQEIMQIILLKFYLLKVFR